MQKIAPADDAKLQHLKTQILSKLASPINPGNRKILIFTAFADTANYLYEHLAGTLLAHQYLYRCWHGLCISDGTNSSASGAARQGFRRRVRFGGKLLHLRFRQLAGPKSDPFRHAYHPSGKLHPVHSMGARCNNAGNVLIADWGANVIRKVTPSGIISNIAGNGTGGYSGDGGLATDAELNGPHRDRCG